MFFSWLVWASGNDLFFFGVSKRDLGAGYKLSSFAYIFCLGNLFRRGSSSWRVHPEAFASMMHQTSRFESLRTNIYVYQCITHHHHHHHHHHQRDPDLRFSRTCSSIVYRKRLQCSVYSTWYLYHDTLGQFLES